MFQLANPVVILETASLVSRRCRICSQVLIGKRSAEEFRYLRQRTKTTLDHEGDRSGPERVGFRTSTVVKKKK